MSDDVPSNSELAERTVRIEEQMDHVVETVDRIDERITDEQEEIEEIVEDNAEKVGTMWAAYRFTRWFVPVAGSIAAGLGALITAGVV